MSKILIKKRKYDAKNKNFRNVNVESLLKKYSQQISFDLKNGRASQNVFFNEPKKKELPEVFTLEEL